MKGKNYLLIMVVFLGISCTHEDNHTFDEVYIDFNSIKTLDLSKGKEINLEISENSIIKRIDELLIIEGQHYFIRSGSDLFLFGNNGIFKNSIGSKGNGPHEFTHFNSFFVKNDIVYIYDAMAKKILSYDFKGNFINVVSLKQHYTDILPNYIHPIQDNKFISKNTFGGEDRKTPSYSILGNDYTIRSHIKGRYLKNGITTLNNFFSNDDYTLFWELMNDTIFSIVNDTTYEQKYYVNFNEKAIPQSIKKLDLYDAIELTNKPENIKKYATLIRSVNEDKSFLRFVFAYNKEIYYVKYDKHSNEVRTYRLTYKDRTIEPLFYLYNKMIFFPVNNADDNLNPSLVILDESIL